MLVCMLLVVGRIARHAVAARTGVEEERRLGCLAPGVFVLRFGRALLSHNNYIFSCHLCVFLCASEYTEIETHSLRRHRQPTRDVRIRKTTGVQPS